MKHLLGGQIGLEDFIFAHRKGKGFCDIINYTKKYCLDKLDDGEQHGVTGVNVALLSHQGYLAF